MIYKKTLSWIALMSAICLGDSSFYPNDQTVRHSKYVFSVSSNYDYFSVEEGKSRESTLCKIKVDIKKGLLNTNECDVKEITLFNADTLWLGSLKTSDGTRKFESYHSYTNIKTTGIDVDDVAFVIVWFDVKKRSLMDFSSVKDFSELIKCDNPDASIKYSETDSTFSCYTPWVCGKFWGKTKTYSVSESECNFLPDHAKRNKHEGFTCDKGYILSNNTCVIKAKCKKNERYFQYNNSCQVLPMNSHWKDSVVTIEDFECNDGYKLEESNCVILEDDNFSQSIGSSSSRN